MLRKFTIILVFELDSYLLNSLFFLYINSYSTLLTVVLSTFIFSVMLTVIAFVCCKKFWKSRENLNLEIVDDQLYNRNPNFLTLNAAQLINAYNANGIPIQTDAIRSSTPTSSTNALPQTILSPSITGAHNNSNNNINNSLPAIVSSSLNTYSPSMASNLYTSTNSNQPYTTINQQPLNAQAMSNSINTTFSGQSIAMTGYSVHPHQNVHPQALQQALIFYDPPPPYNSNNEINRTFTNESNTQTTTATTNSQPPPTTATVANTNNPNTTSNIDINTINLLPNSIQASASYQQPANNDHQTNTNDLTTNIFSQRLLLALGNYRRQDTVYPVLDQPRKKLCRTLSQ